MSWTLFQDIYNKKKKRDSSDIYVVAYLSWSDLETYSGTCQTSMMKLSAKIVFGKKVDRAEKTSAI